MDKLLVEHRGPLGWLILNNPEKRNAVTLQMWRAIPERMAELNRKGDVRVIVLRGAGQEAFAAGADISEFREVFARAADAENYYRVTFAAYQALRLSEKPVIAMIRGICFGGGCTIAINCDLRIASEDAKFSIPGAKLGVGYGYEHIKQVVDTVGPAHAREMLCTARIYDAAQALNMGLVHRLVPGEKLESYTRRYAARIAGNAPLTIHEIKVAIEEYLKDPERRDLDRAKNATDACFESDDYREGYSAFLEKRQPRFNGR